MISPQAQALWQAFAQAPKQAELPLEARRQAGEQAETPTSEPVGVTNPAAPEVAGLWALPAQPRDGAAVLYLFGGGYVLGSPASRRKTAGHVANAAAARVLVPDYRLAPEHPFPAAIEDAVSAYEWMLDRGLDASEISLSGDSSGGGLVVSVLMTLEQRGLPRPGGAVLMCPWVDLALTLTPDAPEISRRFAAAYLGERSVDDPVVSPLTTDLSGLPPLLIQAATGDDRLADANALVDRAREHGVDARLDLYSVDAHVFQIFWSFLPEAAEALKAAGDFAREVTTSEPLPAATAPRARAASGPAARRPRAPRG